MSRILITGAAGQIGSELTPALREVHGHEAVVATGLDEEPPLAEPYEYLDVTDEDRLVSLIEEYDIEVIYHLAAILSAKGERDPLLTHRVNVDGLLNVFEAARTHDLDQVIVPSTIAVFGPETPLNPAEETILRPRTMYGITKVHLELLAAYYYQKFDIDIRGVRVPGILSYKTRPGGGTTDYAVEAFYAAIESGSYTYFVREDTRLPMMYMPDAIDALLTLAAADDADLRYRCEYNVSALEFTAGELTDAIAERIPGFEATYEPDDRQAIADSWPDRIDDTAARDDWGWSPSYDLDALVNDMLDNLRTKLD